TMLPSMENTRENWLHRLAKLPPQAEIALEVSTSGHFVMSVLEEAGWRERAHWVHTAGVDSLKKQKNDRLDAKRLGRKRRPVAREYVERTWRVHGFLSAERESSEASLVAASASFPEMARLQTIPGLGHILAAVIWSEIGDLRRFASADALVNYTGLVPSLYE